MEINHVFPIPTSPFEEYFLRDDRPGYPMTMPLLFMFRGHVHVRALEEAFNKTILHEPLLCAVVQQRNGFRYWVKAPELPRLVQETDLSTEGYSISEGVERIVTLDITKKPGIYCRYIPMADGFAIRIHVHHAVCDGLGTILFLGNWMAEYARLIGDGSDLPFHFPVPERIKSRTDFRIELPHPLSRWTIIKSLMKEFRHWFGRPVYALSPDGIENADSSSVGFSNPVLLWKTITNTDGMRIRQRARSLGVSLNSYLTGRYFQYLSHRIDKKRITARYRVRLLVPTNLRKPAHFNIPASNMIGYAFLDRRASECISSESFYRSIDHDIDVIKKWSMGSMFLSGVDMMRRIPFALSMVLSSKNCLATSVFSNIGNPCKILPYRRFQDSGTIEVDGMKLYRIIGAPPIRPNTPFCCGLIQQNSEITISMTVDSSRFGLEKCREFHGGFIKHVTEAEL